MKKYLIDVYVADDHMMFCDGLKEAVNRSDVARISRCFPTLAACDEAMRERRPDVLLLDISMPDGDSLAFCRHIIDDYPQTRVVAVTMHDEYSLIQRMLGSGAHGYVLKSSSVEQLLDAIVAVWKGNHYISPEVDDIVSRSEPTAIRLTPVEEQILRLVSEGLTNSEIAARQHLSTETVNWYRKRLLGKCDAKNTADLVRIALRDLLV